MAVPENHRAPGAHVIDIAVAVNVPHAGAVGPIDYDRLGIDGLARSGGRIDASRQHLLSSFKDLMRFGRGKNCLCHLPQPPTIRCSSSNAYLGLLRNALG